MDISGSMNFLCATKNGKSCRRIDAVFDAVEIFADALGAMHDTVCSLAVFNDDYAVKLSREATLGGRLREKIRGLRGGVRPGGGGYYLTALQALQHLASDADVSVAVLLSDGVPSEELMGRDGSAILGGMQRIRRKFGERVKLHTMGFGSFDSTCLRQLAEAGRGSFFANPALDAGELRTAFQQVSTHVSTVRTSVLTYGAAGLEELPPLEMEAPDAWEAVPPAERETLGRAHWAWIVVGQDELMGSSGGASGSGNAGAAGAGAEGDDDLSDLKPRGDARRVIYHRKPFAQGGLRYAFHLFLSSKEGQRDMHLVVKESKFKGTHSTPQEVHKFFLNNHRRAQASAKAFNRACKGIITNQQDATLALASRSMAQFVKAFVVQVDDPGSGSGFRFVTAENYIPGVYVKFNDNNGHVNEQAEKEPSEVAAAFSHFTFDHTDGDQICVDVQGVGIKWTDPQLHSRDRTFGPADHGQQGMKRFFASHACSSLCCALGLRSVDQDTLELGKVVEQPEQKVCLLCLDGARQYMCVPCRHVCYCAECYLDMPGRLPPCPVCRQEVRICVKIQGRASATFVKPSAPAAGAAKKALLPRDSLLFMGF